MIFNEDSRVKLPATLHLCKLGFDYLSLSKATWDTENNIFTSIFYESIQSLNPEMDTGEIKLLYDKLTLTLDNEDLGKSFYEILTAETGPRIIDFDDFSKNKLQVVTELPNNEFIETENALIDLASKYIVPDNEKVDSFIAQFGDEFALKVYSTKMWLFEDEIVWYSIKLQDQKICILLFHFLPKK